MGDEAFLRTWLGSVYGVSMRPRPEHRKTVTGKVARRVPDPTFSVVIACPVRELRPVRDWDKQTRDICEGLQLAHELQIDRHLPPRKNHRQPYILGK